jgi:uncharacterized membrane protein (GlpM family)
MNESTIIFILGVIVPFCAFLFGIFFLMYMFNLDAKKDKKKHSN